MTETQAMSDTAGSPTNPAAEDNKDAAASAAAEPKTAEPKPAEAKTAEPKAAEPQPVGVRDVRRGHLPCELLARNAALPRRVVDLVVHVGDVHHQLRVVALALEKALE